MDPKSSPGTAGRTFAPLGSAPRTDFGDLRDFGDFKRKDPPCGGSSYPCLWVRLLRRAGQQIGCYREHGWRLLANPGPRQEFPRRKKFEACSNEVYLVVRERVL